MPKYCHECGETLSENARFCSECRTAIFNTEQSINTQVEGNINGTMNIAGGNIIQVDFGNLVDCRVCDATGEVKLFATCKDCAGYGYWTKGIGSDVVYALASDAQSRGIRYLSRFGSQKETTLLNLFGLLLVSEYCFVQPCVKCGGGAYKALMRKENLNQMHYEITGNARQGFFAMNAIPLPQHEQLTNLGAGLVVVKTKVCISCHGQGKIRL